MRFFSLATLALLVAPILGSPVELKKVEVAAGAKKPGSYIVTLTGGVSKSKHVQALLSHLSPEDSITHGDWDSRVINGFAAKLGPAALNFLRSHPDVARIEEDAIMTTQAVTTQVSVYEHGIRSSGLTTGTVQTNAPWGLQRISQAASLSSTSTTALTYSYDYDTRAGSGVDVYVVGTLFSTSSVNTRELTSPHCRHWYLHWSLSIRRPRALGCDLWRLC